MSPSFYWGFLADNKSISGVLWYLVEISGFFFVGMIVAAVFLKRGQRVVLMGCLLPMAFAFLVSLTPDINVNHLKRQRFRTQDDCKYGKQPDGLAQCKS